MQKKITCRTLTLQQSSSYLEQPRCRCLEASHGLVRRHRDAARRDARGAARAASHSGRHANMRCVHYQAGHRGGRMDTCVSDKLSGTCRWIEQPAVYDQPATERASEDTVNIQPDVPRRRLMILYRARMSIPAHTRGLRTRRCHPRNSVDGGEDLTGDLL